jgi:hypothetical protein
VILAQLTDTHVLEAGKTQFLDNNAMLAQAVGSLKAEDPRPDAVIGTGDLVNWGRPAQYASAVDEVRLDWLRAALASATGPLVPALHHRPITTTVGGVTTTVCPSTVHQMALDLGPGERATVVRDPRGYQLHLVDGPSVITHTRYIDTGEAPFDPGWD